MMRGTLIRGVERADSFGKKVWDLTWGLLLVVGLTVMSEYGLQLGYAKPSPAAAPVTSRPVVRSIK